MSSSSDYNRYKCFINTMQTSLDKIQTIEKNISLLNFTNINNDINALQNSKLNNTEDTIDGNLTVNSGNLSVGGNISSSGNLTINGNINVTGTINSQNINDPFFIIDYSGVDVSLNTLYSNFLIKNTYDSSYIINTPDVSSIYDGYHFQIKRTHTTKDIELNIHSTTPTYKFYDTNTDTEYSTILFDTTFTSVITYISLFYYDEKYYINYYF